MLVNEIFRSIQGESTYTGLPCIFVRLTGCNLRCSYCDSKYAYKEGTKMTINQVFNEIKKLYVKGDIIEFTGGEPMLQKEEVNDLIYILLTKLPIINILIETNGSILLPQGNWITYIMDWKLPSSGMNNKMEYANLPLLNKEDELKFVIQTDKDYNEMKRILKKYNPQCKILVSTVWGIDKKKYVEKILKDKLNVRFQVQLHKLVWNPKKRGV